MAAFFICRDLARVPVLRVPHFPGAKSLHVTELASNRVAPGRQRRLDLELTCGRHRRPRSDVRNADGVTPSRTVFAVTSTL